MRVLVSAYACEPGLGSEPGAGWAWARAAAENHEVWVLTARAHQDQLDAYLRDVEPDLPLHPVYVDYPAWSRRWQRDRRGIHLYYVLWQVLAALTARRLHRHHDFEVVHHLTYATDWMPAGVAHAVDRPFVWGPVGGSTGMPWRLWRWVGARGLAEEVVRTTMTAVLRPLFGGAAARRAAVVVAQNADSAAAFEGHPGLVVEPNARVDPAVADTDPAERPADERRAVFAGRLLHWKGLRLAIAAIARPESAAWQLHVFGSGPEEEPCRELADRLGVADRVVFRGHVPRESFLRELAAADALLYPSMHDSAPFLVSEARTLGVPVVCLDRGGPPLLMGHGTAVPDLGPAETVRALAAGLAGVDDEHRPDPRWSTDALPSLLDDLYRRAAGVDTDDALAVGTRDPHG